MAKAIYRRGPDSVPYTPSGVTIAGTVIRLGDLRAAVVCTDLAASQLGEAYVRGGIDFPKAATTGSVAFADGAPVYWSVSTELAIMAPAATEDYLVGSAQGVSAIADSWVHVALNEAGGRTFARRVNDGSMDATPGFEGEIMYDDSSNKAYKCTASSATAGTYVELDES